MPSTYAHDRFGRQVFGLLPDRLKTLISSHMDLFYLGLHGPDLLFYYHPLSSNPVSSVGYQMHDVSGFRFFSLAGNILKENGFLPAHLSYLYGFLCHFALDASCHGYIEERIQESGISHTEIEVEFDRRLLALDGYHPVSKKLTDNLHPGRPAAEVICRYFSGVNSNQIYQSIKSMIFYNNLMVAPCPLKRGTLYLLLKLADHWPMHDHIIRYRPDSACTDSNRILLSYYKQARNLAVRLICQYTDTIQGKLPWDPVYSLTFSSENTGSLPAERNKL